jgi:manganese efflux pump family protein
MRVVALISWIVAALAGATLFSIWLSRGGLRRQRPGASRFPPALILGHPILAVTGLILWIVYVASDTDGLRWVAFAILVVVATLGFPPWPGCGGRNARPGWPPPTRTGPPSRPSSTSRCP